MAGYNLVTMRAWMLHKLEAIFPASQSYAYPDSLLFSALNEAQRQIADAAKVRKTEPETLNIVAGQSAYLLPGGISGQEVETVEALDEAGEWQTLSRRSYLQAAQDAAFETPTGDAWPTQWCPDATTPNTLLLLPQPTVSRTAGLRLRSRAFPGTLWLAAAAADYTDGALYVDLTKGSTAAACKTSGGVASADAYVSAGVEIGAVAVDLSNNAVPPYVWYTIETVASGGIWTLRTPAIETLPATSYLVAQVPDLEQLYPGRFGHTMIDLATALVLDLQRPDLAKPLRDRAMGAAVLFRKDDPPGPIRRQTTTATPFFTRR